MARIFKSLQASDYSITPFPTTYHYTIAYTSASATNTVDVTLLHAVRYTPQTGSLRTANAEYELFDSIQQLFYSPIARERNGIVSGSSYIPSSSSWVISIAQDLFGERIVPGSVRLTVDSTSSVDDGKGNLIVSSSGTGSIVGGIFYDKGIITVLPTGSSTSVLSNAGLRIVSGGTLQVQFSASRTAYEHSVKAKLYPNEFLYSVSNPSAQGAPIGTTTSSADLMHRGALRPYVTTIGFYNSKNELLMVGKLSVPVQRTSDLTQTFVVKFDT